MSVKGVRIGRAVLLAGCLALSMSSLSIPSIVEYVSAGAAGAESQQKPAAGQKKPDDNRFTAVTIVPAGELDEPMVFQVLRDGSVLIVERKGVLKLYEAASKTTKVVAKIPVNTKYTNAAGEQREAEEGLVGLTLDPGFEKNHWIYMLYADPEVAKHALARWTLEEKKDADGQRTMALVDGSKKVLLEYRRPARAVLPHGRRHGVGQGRQPLHDGRQQYVQLARHAVGRAAGPPAVGRPARRREHQRPAREDSPHSSRAGRHLHDPEGQPLSARHRERPAGDLHHGQPQPVAREHRQPDRLRLLGRGRSRRQRTTRSSGRAATTSTTRRRRRASSAGRTSSARTRPSPFATSPPTSRRRRRIRPSRSNTSVNNTGLRELPPAQPAFISYPYGPSDKFPEVGSGARSADGGPIYRRADFPTPGGPFPEYYEGKWFISDFSRGGSWRSRSTRSRLRLDGALPARPQACRADRHEVRPRRRSLRARLRQHLVREEPDDSLIVNRVQRRQSHADGADRLRPHRRHASVPDRAFRRRRPIDYDGDQLKYEWTSAAGAGGAQPRVPRREPAVTFDKRRHLRRDALPSAIRPAPRIPPRSTSSPATTRRRSTVDVAGREQDVLHAGHADRTRSPSPTARTAASPPRWPLTQVALSIDYVPEGFDVASVSSRDKVDATTRYGVGKALMSKTDCATCHNRDTKFARAVVHPARREVPARARHADPARRKGYAPAAPACGDRK